MNTWHRVALDMMLLLSACWWLYRGLDNAPLALAIVTLVVYHKGRP